MGVYVVVEVSPNIVAGSGDADMGISGKPYSAITGSRCREQGGRITRGCTATVVLARFGPFLLPRAAQHCGDYLVTRKSKETLAVGKGVKSQVEDDSDAETYGEENEEQGNYSRRKIVSNWDRYQDTEKEVDNESGESQRGTDFSVLLSSAGDSFSQFRFAEEKEWDGDVSCPKQNPAFYVDCESLARALQELPLSLRLNIAAELVQTALPLELPQVKPKRNDDGKGLGKQLKGPLGPGGKGSLSELKSAAAGCATYPGKGHPGPGPSQGPQNPATLLLSAVDHLEEELDLLLNLDAPVKEGGDLSSDQTTQDLGSEKDGEAAQEEKDPARASVLEEKNVESKQPSISKSVTEEELEDWLDSMIS
nr:PREDICTED: cell death regulator Aven [Camelus bactrianus]